MAHIITTPGNYSHDSFAQPGPAIALIVVAITEYESEATAGGHDQA